MRSDLERAIEAPEIVRALKCFGLTQDDVAAVAQVTSRAVRGWKSSAPRPASYDRLAELRDLVSLLADSLSPRGVKQWLMAKNRLLGGSRPLDLLAAGHFKDVERAAQAFVDGAYV